MRALILLLFFVPVELEAREGEKSVFDRLMSHPQIGFLENCLYLDDERIDTDLEDPIRRKALFKDLATPLAGTFDPFSENGKTLCDRLYEGLPNASCGVTANRLVRLVQPDLQEKRAEFREQLKDGEANPTSSAELKSGELALMSAGAAGLFEVLKKFYVARAEGAAVIALLDFGPHTFLLESRAGMPGSVYLHQSYDGFFSLTTWAHKGRTERKVDSLVAEMLRILERYHAIHLSCQKQPDSEIYSSIEKLFVHPVVKVLPVTRKSCDLLEPNRVYFSVVDFQKSVAQARVDRLIGRCSRLRESLRQYSDEFAGELLGNVEEIYVDFPNKQKLKREVTACLKFGRGA